jgi:hypothetical protein
MKTYALCLTLALAFCAPAFADDAPNVSASGPSVSLTPDPKTPAVIQRIADGFHIVDNGTPSTFYDVAGGVWLAGAITTIYKKYYTSVDVGLAAPMVADSKGEFAGGFRVHPAEWAMDKIPAFKEFVTVNGLQAGIMKYAAAGLFASYNWTPQENEKNWRWGPYAGIEYRFY